MGWRVYASNDLELSLPEAVYGYRNEYLIEQGFGRYKGKALGLRPIYLAYDQRVKGLIRLPTEFRLAYPLPASKRYAAVDF